MIDQQRIGTVAAVALAAAVLVVTGASPAHAQDTRSTVTPEQVPPAPPALSPAALQPLRLEYHSTIAMGGNNRITVNSTRVVGPASLSGHRVWRVATTTLGESRGGTDVVYLDPATLRPLHRSVDKGGRSLELSYSDGWVRGHEGNVKTDKPIAVSVPGPVFGEGGALDAVLVSLPLTEGYETSFDAFDLAARASRQWDVKVVGTAELELPAGAFATFKVAVTPDDGGRGGGTYWVSTDRPRMVVQSRTTLPGSQGADEVVTVLQSWRLTEEAAPKAD